MWWLIVGIVCGVGVGFIVRDRTRSPRVVSAPVVDEPALLQDSEAEIRALLDALLLSRLHLAHDVSLSGAA